MHAITETASNANFVSGIPCPDNGDAGPVWWVGLENARQQLADRTQYLKGFANLRPRVPLVSHWNASSRFTADSGSGCTWQQTSVASAGSLLFPLICVPTGRKILTIVASCFNVASTNISIGTKPALSLGRWSHSGMNTGNLYTASDPTASLGSYQVDHEFSIAAVNHVVLDDYEYYVAFSGETGANSTPGLILTGIHLTLDY